MYLLNNQSLLIRAKTLNLAKARFRIIPVFIAAFIATMFVGPAFAVSGPAVATKPVLHMDTVESQVTLLDPSFNPQTGGVPFCDSVSLGSLICYTPSFIKTAYNFPSTKGFGGLEGTGSTIVIVDAFGSPTIQSDLNTFDSTFGLPPTTVTILCGPTWTGSPTDNCPVKTISDLSTAPNAALCGATGWAEETTLDVTMAHSLAPGAKIVLVVANDCYDTSLYGAEMAVVSQHQYRGSIMSQSFGEPDDLVTCTATDPTNTYCTARDPTLLNLPNSVFQLATKNHWTIIASSGDDGANEDTRVLGTGEFTPSFPATSPLVLAAGGTQGYPYGGQYGAPPGKGGTNSCPARTFCDTGLVVIYGGNSGCSTAIRPGEPTSCVPVGYGGESTWNEFNIEFVGTVSGGGVSSLYSRPFYQQGLPKSVTTLFGNTVKINGRATPDVAFNAAAQGGWLAPLGFITNPCTSSVCPGPDWAVFSGTSAASPAWAGIMALVDQANGGPVGFVNPAIYQLGENSEFQSFTGSQSQTNFGFGGSPFHDVTKGNNSDADTFYTNPGFCYTGSPTPGYPVSPPPSGCQPFWDGFVATHGYDLTTGWGTPNVSAFIHAIQQYLGNDNYGNLDQ